MNLLALGKSVANLEDSIVWKSNDVTSPSLVDG